MAYCPASRPTFTTGHRGGVGQHDGHLQQHPQLVADVVGGHAGERLGAVAALEQERLTAGDGGELRLEVVALAGEDQRRQRCAAAPRRRRRRRRSGYVGCWAGAERVQGGQVGNVTAQSLRGGACRRPPGSPWTAAAVAAHSSERARCRGTRSSSLPVAAVGQPGDRPEHDADQPAGRRRSVYWIQSARGRGPTGRPGRRRSPRRGTA